MANTDALEAAAAGEMAGGKEYLDDIFIIPNRREGKAREGRETSC